MSKLEWDKTGERLYETGVEQVAIFPTTLDGTYGAGAAWNGVTNITESPSGAEPTKLYADNRNYVTLMSAEELGVTIEAYTYPDEFAECDGSALIGNGVKISQQPRKPFGLVYKSRIGNDVELDNYGYKIHIIYGCLASPSEKAHGTINDSPEAANMSWELSTTPVSVTDHRPTASVEIDSTTIDASKLAEIEAALYGTEDDEPTLLLPDDIAAILANG